MRSRIPFTVFIVFGLMMSLFSALPPNVLAANSSAQPFTHQSFNGVVGPLTQNGDGPISQATYRNPPSPICSTAISPAADVNTDCEGNAPHNETSIAINPNNPLNLIGGANDYQLMLTSGGTNFETIFTRAHVTFDGGKTWTTYPIDYNNYVATGDPAVAFDAHGRAYLATLGFLWSQGLGCCTNPDVVVSHSDDSGKSWSTPVLVVNGTGSFHSVGLFNDKEYIAAWGDGNAIVTWTEFKYGIGGDYLSSSIYDSVTHDGGKTWSTPVEISGSAPFCIGALGGNDCNQAQFSVPAIAADGSIYVAFETLANLTTTRDIYLVVKVNPDTGERVAGPYKVADLIDGLTDYPSSVNGAQTFQDSEFRMNPAGNITADPTNANHLAVIWSDMRNSTLPAPSDPFVAKTNSDIIVSQSFDGGMTWSAPTALARSGDQFMPWGAYNASGKLQIGFYDRSYDPANHMYGYTLATEKKSGSLTFKYTQLTTALSDPTQGTRWFSGGVVNNATTFLGDYSNIASASNGEVVAFWTDMRLSTCYSVRCGTGQDAFFAPAP
jgi:hypothetical protein